MITKFNIMIFINKFFKYLFEPNVLNLESINIYPDSDSEDEVIDYISE